MAKISNDSCDLDLRPFILKLVCDTSTFMYCMYSTYEVIWPNDRADITKIWNDPCDLDLWPYDLEMMHDILWTHGLCVSHVKWIGQKGTELQSRHRKNLWPWPLTFHMYDKNEVVQPNRGRATEWTWQKLLINQCDLLFKWLVWPLPLTFWPRNGSLHIIMSWTIFWSSIKQISQVGMEPWSEQDKNFAWLCDHDLLPFDLKLYVPQAFYKINVWRKFYEEPVKRTWSKKVLQTNTCTQTDRETDAAVYGAARHSLKNIWKKSVNWAKHRKVHKYYLEDMAWKQNIIP